MTRSATEMEGALSGKAVTAGDGMLHIERQTGTTLCGELVESYPLHWDVTTVIACGICLMEAGVPLHTKAAS